MLKVDYYEDDCYNIPHPKVWIEFEGISETYISKLKIQQKKKETITATSSYRHI